MATKKILMLVGDCVEDYEVMVPCSQRSSKPEFRRRARGLGQDKAEAGGLIPTTARDVVIAP
jgi:hypothetical protein